MGSIPCRKIHLLDIAHPVVRKYFQVLKVHQDVDTSERLVERRARFGIVMCFVNSRKKTQFCLCKKNRVVIKLIYVMNTFW